VSSTPPEQPSLWIEAPEVREGPVARVALAAAVEGEYSFAVPDELADQVEPGKRLLVPFGRGRKPREAFCTSITRERWTNALRRVAGVLDQERLLDDNLIELGRWIAQYYCCPLGRVLSAMLPEAVREQAGFKTVRSFRLAHPEARTCAPAGPTAGETTEDHCSQSSGTQADGKPTKKLSPRRQAVIDALAGRPEGMDLDELLEATGASKGVVAAMVKAGRLSMQTRRVPAEAPNFDRPGTEPTFELSGDQQAAIRRISELAEAGTFKAVLLFGVSGSGKTEIYIHAIRSVLARGKQAIFLVPEIALTTQLADRLASRFHDVAVVHSGLTGARRSLTWSAIARGLKKVIIGTRSAIFAPCPNLGLIVVDEEQEGTYKNQQAPRYNTRDVALKRAQLASIPIVLGSATPSLETWHNCDRLAHFERITLPHRIAGLSMPAVEFVDMRTESRSRPGHIHLLSRKMEQELQATLDAGKQAVLLLNRRGFASYLVCSRCQNPIVCPNCRANMVFHQTVGKAICHHCSAKMVVPRRCGDASCGGTLIKFGMGTQRVEEELKQKFPQARIARADSDSMTRVSKYEQVLRDFLAHKLDVLIGTQMIAKGLDFPEVSFVGVVNADTSLSAPDFRAAERTFQMIAQVAGRAGRARGAGILPASDHLGGASSAPASDPGGRVVVQSLVGMSPALQFAAKHDYESFAAHEMALRKRLGWPPFARLARIILTFRTESQARAEAHRLADLVRQYIVDEKMPADVLGPQSAPLSRLRNNFRYDFLIRCPNASRLMETLSRLRNVGALVPMGKHLTIDVDPVSLL
jgi:primosomal protein N' (replication factor Y)